MQGDASTSRAARGIRRPQRDERPSSRVFKSERASTSRATGIRRPQRDEHPSRRVLKSDRERTEAPDGQRSGALRVRAASDAVPPRTPRSPLTRLLSAMTSAFDIGLDSGTIVELPTAVLARVLMSANRLWIRDYSIGAFSLLNMIDTPSNMHQLQSLNLEEGLHLVRA